jgi:uncharacterized protein (DUF1330 family)
MPLYALNLFDLADNDLYRQYSRRSIAAVGKHGGKVVALGQLDAVAQTQPGVEPRTVMVLVEWPSRDLLEPGLNVLLEGLRFGKPHKLQERAF